MVKDRHIGLIRKITAKLILINKLIQRSEASAAEIFEEEFMCTARSAMKQQNLSSFGLSPLSL